MNDDPIYPPGSTPPKSVAQLRQAIKSIVGANEPPAPGPLQHGLGKTDWVAVQSFKTPAGYYLAVLRLHGVKYRLRQRGKETAVLVRYPDLGLARTLYEKMTPGESPRRRPSRACNPVQRSMQLAAVAGAGIGLLVGALCGAVISAATNSTTDQAPFPALFAAAGAAAFGFMLWFVTPSRWWEDRAKTS